MKLKVVLTGLAVAGLMVSSAVAAPPADKGKPPTTGTGCKPKITVVLKGTLNGAPGASSISVQVTSGNRWGRAYVKATQPTTVGVDTKTKVRRQGLKKLTDLKDADRVLIQARVCKADLADNAVPSFDRVQGHRARCEGRGQEQGRRRLRTASDVLSGKARHGGPSSWTAGRMRTYVPDRTAPPARPLPPSDRASRSVAGRGRRSRTP